MNVVSENRRMIVNTDIHIPSRRSSQRRRTQVPNEEMNNASHRSVRATRRSSRGQAADALIANPSLAALHAFISPMAGSASVRVEEDISETFRFPAGSAERMYSSGSSNDCLIHSFLTVVCPHFRSLSQADKVSVASRVRRTILPAIALRNPHGFRPAADLARFRRDCAGRDFLSDADAKIIANFFGVNLLMLEPDRAGFPITATLIEPVPHGTTFVIYGSGVHFSGVRIGGNYTYAYGDAVAKVAEITGLRGVGADGCEFARGAKVTHEDVVYTVIDLKRNNESCVSYTITSAVGSALDRLIALAASRDIVVGDAAPGVIKIVPAGSVRAA